MFYRYFIIFSALLSISFSYASDSDSIEPPPKRKTSVVKVKIGEIPLGQPYAHCGSISLTPTSSPRTPKNSAYKNFCIRILLMPEIGEKNTFLVTPSIKPFHKKDSPHAKNFFVYQEFDLALCLSLLSDLDSETCEMAEESSTVRIRIWQNRNLILYLVELEALEEALKSFPKKEESFEELLYKKVKVIDDIKTTDYFLTELAGLKRAWKYLYDDLGILAAALKSGNAPLPQCTRNLADRFPVYKRRLKRYVKAFEIPHPHKDKQFDRILKKVEWGRKMDHNEGS